MELDRSRRAGKKRHGKVVPESAQSDLPKKTKRNKNNDKKSDKVDTRSAMKILESLTEHRAWIEGQSEAGKYGGKGLLELLGELKKVFREVNSSKKYGPLILYRQGQLRCCVGDWEGGLGIFKQILLEYPKTRLRNQVLVAMASVQLKVELFDESVETLLGTMERSSCDPYSESEILLLTGVVLEQQKESKSKKRGKFKGLRKEVFHDAFQKREPDSFKGKGGVDEWLDRYETWEAVGLTCYEHGNIYLALKCFQRALTTSSCGGKVSRLWVRVAKCYRFVEEFESSLEACGTAFQLDPFDLELRKLLLRWDPGPWTNYFEGEAKVVSSVQARVRSFLARQRFRKLVQVRELRLCILREVTARTVEHIIPEGIAYCLQKHSASVRIQSLIRMFLGQNLALRVKRDREMGLAAMKIQRVYRGMVVRVALRAKFAEIRRWKRAILDIQRVCRGFLGRQRVILIRLRRKCAIQIQCFIRGILAKIKVKRIRERHVIRIQSVYRAHLVRSGIREMMNEATHRRRSVRDLDLSWTSLEWRMKAMKNPNSPRDAKNSEQWLVKTRYEPRKTLSSRVGKTMVRCGNSYRLNEVETLFVCNDRKEIIWESLGNSLEQASHLRVLGFSGCREDGLESFFAGLERYRPNQLGLLHLEKLETKDLHFAKALERKCLSHLKIHTLNLMHCNLGDHAMKELAKSLLYCKSLVNLCLDGNQISQANWLVRLTQVKELSLKCNRIDDIGAQCFAKAFIATSPGVDQSNLSSLQLTKLYLDDNSVTNIGALSLLAALKHENTKVTSLLLHFNPISRFIAHQISMACAEKLTESFLLL